MSVDAQTIAAGTMLRSARNGDISTESDPTGGLFTSDVRLLSQLLLTIDGQACAVAAESAEPGARTVVLIPRLARHDTSHIVLTRTQAIDSSGMREELTIENVANVVADTSIALEIGSDFADAFMLRSDRRAFDRSSGTFRWRSDDDPHPSRIVARYYRSRAGRSFTAELVISPSDEPAISVIEDGADSRATIVWAIRLPPGEVRTLTWSAMAGTPRPIAPLRPVADRAGATELDAARDRAIADINSLRMPLHVESGDTEGQPDYPVVAAGAPWFLTLFGRDSLITSLLAERELPGLAEGNLRALSATQATESDPSRCAQPGKILHELRNSELARLDEVPFDRYYGSVDATPLYLSALATLGSAELQLQNEASARRAIEWMLGSGGIRDTGFLRYVSDPNGLITQGWKDSADSIAHADGRIATGAIALCEVQGYAWRALHDSSLLARDVWNDSPFADELNSAADHLRDQFRADFWMTGGDFPALALDGDNDRVEVVASNAGHLLYSGMLTKNEAAQVATRLLDRDMFTGWGIRTLSAREARYNPLAYHNGAVWPHDSALAAVGMASYGMLNEARIVATAVVEAAAHFDNRPPELFGGLDRETHPSPVSYEKAATPQAWASAGLLACIRVLTEEIPVRLEFT